MAKFSSVATLILPLTFVTGLFGMNVRVPWQSDQEDTMTAFSILTIIMLVYAIVGVVLFRKRRWI